ncbi:unnamed protein product [Urochloa humidicola]
MGEECKEAGAGRHAEEGLVVDPAHTEKLYEDVPPMPLMALNHISRLCKSVDASVQFYVKALGFVLIHPLILEGLMCPQLVFDYDLISFMI